MNVVKTFIPPKPLETAVLFLIFRRPDTTRQVFEQIKKAKPPRLYIAADGPRENITREAELVKQTREYVLNNIDWDCEVKTLFREKNLGCGRAVSEAITWFFEHEEMGIILEDDTVPSLSFFWFCEELLKRYKDDMRVWHIGGNNFGFDNIKNIPYSYMFVRFAQVWGWATWKSRWDYFDFYINKWSNNIVKNSIKYVFPDLLAYYRKKKHFEMVAKGRIDIWDYQWQFIVMINNGLCIVPSVNLISNVGSGLNATHTKIKDKRLFLPKKEILFPLVHPDFFLPYPELEKHMINNMGMKFSLKDLVRIVLWKM